MSGLRLRNRHFFVLDVVALATLPAVALVLRLDGFPIPDRYTSALLWFTLLGFVVRLPIFWRAGLYNRYWRYASVDEIALIVTAVVVATVANTTVFFGIHLLPSCSPPAAFLDFSSGLRAVCRPILWLPRSVPFIDGLLTLVLVGGGHFSVRLAEHWGRRGGVGGKRVLIIGAGDAGRMIAREIQNNPHLRLEPLGFIDDDATKHGVKIQGLVVFGGRDRLARVVQTHRVKQAIIAMPTAPGKTIRSFVKLCEEAGVETKTIPGVYELLSGRVSINQIRDVEIEDLLRREPIRIETDEVVRLVRGKRVLVTGAGGSIGSEICRQVAHHGAAELILLGHGENSIFQITRELRTTHQTSSISLRPVIADIRDLHRIQTVFARYRPHLVFHAAAHKHVPLMERNVVEAVTNNVLGTKCLIEVAEETDVGSFVLISTDKAVNPTSLMGVTKRVAEKLVEAAATHNGRTFVAVRFGNVLGSRGSVVQVFRKQIARGGPITVTHPDMRRYFMTIPEAVQLVLQAAAIGEGGEVFVLDMGEPVRIVDLARDLIELSGLEVGRDVDIEFIGMRPGEKLCEELFAESETYRRTHHEKIFVARNGYATPSLLLNGREFPETLVDQPLEEQVAALIAAAQRDETDEVRRLLQGIVPEYQVSV